MKRIGIDIGGTFTDLVAFDAESNKIVHIKVLSTPRSPWRGVFRALEKLGWNLPSINTIIHATTLGANMFLGQTGLEIPKAALITNEGFRDIIEIGRQNRPELYNLFFEKPKPLIPRSRRYGVRGRIGSSGKELEPLDTNRVRDIAKSLCSEVEVFIISFLHSYINPVHEIMAKEIIQKECPNTIVITSHEVDPQPKEYERTSTTIVNALLKPMLSKYLDILRSKLEKMGFRGKLLVMQSSGGVAGVEQAIETPVAFIESGPAAGAVAVAYFSKLMSIEKALGFDMGGTTAKASAILNGTPLITSEYEVGGRVHMGRLLRGSGYPVRYPYIDLAEVSAGGGTIAWIDEGGALRVGPISAGANPGPACYGKGGTEPTITDANLVLGRLPRSLAGGVILNQELAERAISKISNKLGMDIVEVAQAIIKIANTIMARALRLVSVERGHDPRDFSLYAFGGAGPLHAVALATELGVKEVIIPPLPGVFSALGLLVTDYRHDLHRAIVCRANEMEEGTLEKIFQELELKALSILKAEGVSDADIKILRFLDIKYWGQAYELTIPYQNRLKKTIEEFHRVHRERYGFDMCDEPVIVVNARITAYGLITKPNLSISEPSSYRPRPIGVRKVYFEDMGWVETRLYRRSLLRPGAEIKGPAIIESDESTVLIPSNYTAFIDSFRAIHITRL